MYFCTRFEKQAKQNRRHVRRHIELTAALTEMLEQKNKE